MSLAHTGQLRAIAAWPGALSMRLVLPDPPASITYWLDCAERLARIRAPVQQSSSFLCGLWGLSAEPR